MKISALNVDLIHRFRSQFFRFKETCTWGHQRAVPRRSRYFTIVGQSSVKTVADRPGHATYHNKH